MKNQQTHQLRSLSENGFLFKYRNAILMSGKVAITLLISLSGGTSWAQVVSDSLTIGSTDSGGHRLAECLAASRQRSGKFYYGGNSDDVVDAQAICQSKDSSLLFVAEENERVIRIGLMGSLGSRIEPLKDQAMLRVIDMARAEEVKRIPCGKATVITAVGATSRGDTVMSISSHQGSAAVARQLSLPSPGSILTIGNSSTGELRGSHPKLGWSQVHPLEDSNRAFVLSENGVAVVDTDDPSSKTLWSDRLNVDDVVEPVLCAKANTVLVPIMGRRDEDPLFAVYRLNDGYRSPTKYVAKDVPDSGGRRVSHIAVNKDESLVAIGCDGFLLVMDLRTGVEVRRLGVGDPVLEDRSPLCVHFSDDNQTVDAVWSKDWMGTKWDLDSGERLSSFYYAGPPLEFSNNGRVLFHETETGTIDISDVQTGLPVLKLHLFHSDRRWLAETIDGYCVASSELQDQEQLMFETAGLTIDPSKVYGLMQALLADDKPTTLPPPSPNVSEGSGHAYVLSYGVSRHQYAEYNLDHAATDAVDFADRVRQALMPSFQKVRHETKVNEQVTVDSIREGLAWLERSTTNSDTAIVFFSGHGVKGRNGLYLVPHGGDLQAMQYTCLNWSEIAQCVSRLKAKNIILLIDCCHAGAFGDDVRANGVELSAGLAKRSGFYMLCSSSGREVSLENEELGHGAFTQSVIETFSNRADVNGDRSLSLREFTEYVQKRVSELTNGKQHPTLPFKSSINLDDVFISLSGR